ncbi:DUF4390 domain-containing protein [Nitrosomonas sp. PY1]|uniref:DUF4390 domain-containing protein n=1 Tax=Nitrosomonas sp. PY1 TaxID=1803906 RepID=UPI001FC89AAD|nr:DUF4390 domain-containing protein [Nitrosomonas sp. PY1]
MLISILSMNVSHAGSIHIKSVEMVAVNQGYEINVDSEIALNATLERALEKGIILYFATKLTLEDSRWFLVSDEVARAKLRVALRYYALTRQYQLNYLSSSQNFNTLKEALRALGRLRGYPLTIKDNLREDVEYMASLRIWFDLTRMPKPFQVEALASSQWELTSDRLEWRMKLPVIGKPMIVKEQ